MSEVFRLQGKLSDEDLAFYRRLIEFEESRRIRVKSMSGHAAEVIVDEDEMHSFGKCSAVDFGSLLSKFSGTLIGVQTTKRVSWHPLVLSYQQVEADQEDESSRRGGWTILLDTSAINAIRLHYGWQ